MPPHEPIPHYLNPDLKLPLLYALILVGIIYLDEKSAKWHYEEEGLADRVHCNRRGSRLPHDINNIWLKCSKFLCGFEEGNARIEGRFLDWQFLLQKTNTFLLFHSEEPFYVPQRTFQ